MIYCAALILRAPPAYTELDLEQSGRAASGERELSDKFCEVADAPTGFMCVSSCPGQPDQSRLLRERLAELEIEIERFKKENAALTKLRQESERNQEILR